MDQDYWNECAEKAELASSIVEESQLTLHQTEFTCLKARVILHHYQFSSVETNKVKQLNSNQRLESDNLGGRHLNAA